MTPAPTRETTRQRILRLADDLFARHGYAAVSMRAVAEAAGVTKPALYYHFRDKEALFEECVRTSQEALGERLRRVTARSAHLRDQIAAVCHTLLTTSPHHPVRTHSDVTEHLPADARRRLGEGFRESIFAPVASVFAAAAARGELREDVSPVVAASVLLGIAMVFLGDDDGLSWLPVTADPAAASPETASTLVADLLLEGIAN